MFRGGPDFRERDSKNVISEEYILPRFKSPWILTSLLPHQSSLKSKTFELRNAISYQLHPFNFISIAHVLIQSSLLP